MPSDAKPLRNAQIDNLKAIAIVFVVLGHAIESAGLPYRPSGATVYALIYFWHMLVGSALIIGTGIYAFYRERLMARQTAAQPDSTAGPDP